jgi:hypothetical protein
MENFGFFQRSQFAVTHEMLATQIIVAVSSHSSLELQGSRTDLERRLTTTRHNASSSTIFLLKLSKSKL